MIVAESDYVRQVDLPGLDSSLPRVTRLLATKLREPRGPARPHSPHSPPGTPPPGVSRPGRRNRRSRRKNRSRRGLPRSSPNPRNRPAGL